MEYVRHLTPYQAHLREDHGVDTGVGENMVAVAPSLSILKSKDFQLLSEFNDKSTLKTYFLII